MVKRSGSRCNRAALSTIEPNHFAFSNNASAAKIEQRSIRNVDCNEYLLQLEIT